MDIESCAILLIASIIKKLVDKKEIVQLILTEIDSIIEIKKDCCDGCGICVKMLPDVYEIDDQIARVKSKGIKPGNKMMSSRQLKNVLQKQLFLMKGDDIMMRTAKTFIQIFFMVTFLIVVLKGNMMICLGIFVISLISAFIFGRFYCGYICPINTLMGIAEKLSKYFKWQTKTVPELLMSKALPWFVLVSIIVAIVISNKYIHKDIPILLILMLLSIEVSLRFEQWVFHNQICPFGALLNLAGKHARYSTKVNRESCVGCKKC